MRFQSIVRRAVLGRNKETNQKIRDERKEQILSKALLLFSTQGLPATKITDISSAAGISQGLVYHYFRSKEEIFIELIRGAFERLNNACDIVNRLPLSPRDKISTVIEGLLLDLENDEDNARYHLLMSQAMVSEAVPEEAKAIIRREIAVSHELMAQILREGQKDGSIKQGDVEELALVFWTSVNGLAIFKAANREKFKAPDPEILMRLFL
jgi:AcrR family transcriptional regulator